MNLEAFHDRWWEHLLCCELGINDPEPDWLDKDAPPPESAASSHPPNATRASSPSSSGTTAALATTNLTRSQAADRSSSKTAGSPSRPNRHHPDAKALAADGKPCHPWTLGPLQPPVGSPVTVRWTRLQKFQGLTRCSYGSGLLK